MRALIFDFDGLIIDSESPEFESWQRVYEEHGQQMPVEDWVHYVGGVSTMEPGTHLESLLGRKLEWPLIKERRIKHHRELMLDKKVLPGVEPLMRQASVKGWKIGVASSSSTEWVEGGLQRLGLLQFVETVRSRDRVKNFKPHPEPYLLALSDLGADAKQSFAFEDSQTGVAAAKAAGLTVIAVPNALTRLHDLSRADMILESLDHFSLPEH